MNGRIWGRGGRVEEATDSAQLSSLVKEGRGLPASTNKGKMAK